MELHVFPQSIEINETLAICSENELPSISALRDVMRNNIKH